MKIGKRLILLFVTISIIASFSGIIATLSLVKTNREYSEAMERYGFDLGDIAELGMQINAARAYIRDIIFLTDENATNDALAKLQETAKIGNELMPKVEAGLQTEEARSKWKEYMDYVVEYRGIRDQVIEIALKTPGTVDPQAYTLWVNQGAPAINNAISILEEMIQLKTIQGSAVSSQLDAQTRDTILFCAILVAVSLFMALIVAVNTSKSISKPIYELEEVGIKLAQGNLNVDIHYESKNELGLLSESMREATTKIRYYIAELSYALSEFANNNFDLREPKEHFIGEFKVLEDNVVTLAHNMTEILSKIKSAAMQVSAGSDQVSSGAQALAQGATQQASSVQELSASIAEISSQVKQNADDSRRANEKSEDTTNAIMTSNQQMQKLKAAMDVIDEKSVEINKIIKTIEDIAFQTNILALNAAVEAARAGAAGIGFAVVADEVRNLAGKSAEAAKDTSKLIEDSVNSIAEGVQLANATNACLNEAVESVREVTALIAGITLASSQQSEAIAQISVGIDQISSVVQLNSATSEESAAASQELFSQASLMKESVGKFKLKNDWSLGPEDVVAVQQMERHYFSEQKASKY